MDLTFFYTKQLYLLKQKIDHLSERDRVLLLFIVVVVLSMFWFFVIFKLELKSINEKKQHTQLIQGRIAALTQKQKIIQTLISNPNTAQIISHVKELTTEIAKLDQEFNHYNKHYISGRDLASLLHDILKQTMDVTIEDFGTFVLPPTPQQTNTATSQKPASDRLLQVHTIHYRLVIRGTYFPVMHYLQRIEQLPWQLYWDKFDYTVIKYPEGIATVDFYTLKPRGAKTSKKQRANS